jgi:hypothetical protein
MRWRYGETNPVTLPVDSTTEIEIGDLIKLDTDDAKPASSINDIGGAGPATHAAAKELFHDAFVGVAMQRSRDGDTAPIRIATSGVFEFDCDSDTFELGERVGVEVDGSDALEDQKVMPETTANPHQSIGAVAKRVGTANTKVLVEINSTIMRDGPQASA